MNISEDTRTQVTLNEHGVDNVRALLYVYCSCDLFKILSIFSIEEKFD